VLVVAQTPFAEIVEYHPKVSIGVQGVPLEIGEAVRRARAAWPLIDIDDARFAERLTELAGAGSVAAAELHVEDLYLAWACIEGNVEALAAFETRMLPVIDATLARLRIEPGRRDDLVQDLRIHLLIGSGRGPGKLAQYRGCGELERWLHATALRAAYRLARRSRRELALDDADMAAAGIVDDHPALVHWKERCRVELEHAFTAALAVLPRRDRLLLKQHYLDRLTIEEVAALHGIHRSSAARWLALARNAVAEAVLRDFRHRLRVSPTEVESPA